MRNSNFEIHICAFFLQGGTCCKLETVIPVIDAAGFDTAAALAERVRAVALAYPLANAVIIRGAGMLCWGRLEAARPMVELYEYLLETSADSAREAPPQRKSRILGEPEVASERFLCIIMIPMNAPHCPHLQIILAVGCFAK